MKSKSIRKSSWWLMLSIALVLAMFVAAIFYRESASFTKAQGEAGSNGKVNPTLYSEAEEAIKTHDHRRLQVLLEKNPSLVNSMPLTKSGKRDSLLTSAIYWEDEISVRMLLEKGADPNGMDEAVPLDWAVTKLNGMPLDASDEINSLRLHVPSESELLRQHMRKAQLTRARIILLLLDAGANYNVVTRTGDKDVPNLFESLTLSLCDPIYLDPEVLTLFRKSGVVFKWEPGSETIFRQHNLINAMNGVLDPDCVLFMYGR